MIRHPRKKVVRFELRPIWAGTPNEKMTPHAILECGHVQNMGLTKYRPKRMACGECPGARRVM